MRPLEEDGELVKAALFEEGDQAVVRRPLLPLLPPTADSLYLLTRELYPQGLSAEAVERLTGSKREYALVGKALGRRR